MQRQEVLVLLAHANGFCKEVWRAVEAEILAVRAAEHVLHIVAVDLPGHGSNGAPLALQTQGHHKGTPDWDSLGSCVLRAVADEQYRRQQLLLPPLAVVGVGHSLGGAACILAELQSPGTFSRLLLFEPILFNPTTHVPSGKAAGANRRRRVFDSPEQALASWGNKQLFAAWDPRSLRGYVDGGLAPQDRAGEAGGPRQSWVLRCDPETEGAYFGSAIPAHRWDAMSRGDGPTCPTLILIGRTTNIAMFRDGPAYFDNLLPAHCREDSSSSSSSGGGKRRAVEARWMEGTGHMGPLEKPQEFAELIVETASDAAAAAAPAGPIAAGTAARL